MTSNWNALSSVRSLLRMGMWENLGLYLQLERKLQGNLEWLCTATVAPPRECEGPTHSASRLVFYCVSWVLRLEVLCVLSVVTVITTTCCLWCFTAVYV